MLIQSLTQAALGSLGLYPARPWHITHTPLWTLTVASKQLCKDFGGGRALQVSGKTGKGLWGHRGHCLPSTRRILSYTLQSLSVNSKCGVQTPVVVGSNLPRVGTTVCCSCSPGCLTAAPALPLEAPLFPWPLRPAWTQVLTCPRSQTLSLQVCMSQGSWDLWILKHLLLHNSHPYRLTTPPPLPLLDLDLWRSQSSQPAWSLSFGLRPVIQPCLLLRLNVPTLVLWTYPPALSSSSALAGLLPEPQSQAGRVPKVSSCLFPRFAEAISVLPDSKESPNTGQKWKLRERELIGNTLSQ